MFKGLKTLLAGLIAGTVVGVLFAPKKGKELRKELKKEIDEGGFGTETLKETVSEMGKDMSGTETYKHAEKEVKKHSKIAKSAAKDFIDENIPAHTQKHAKKTFLKAKDLFERAKSGVNKVVETIEEKTSKHEE